MGSTKSPDSQSVDAAMPSTAQVRAYLEAHPEFLARHPELLDELAPPARGLGRGVLDLQQFLILRLRRQLALNQQRERDLVDIGRANLTSQAQVHSAVLALLEATSLDTLVQALTFDLAALLDVDAVTLCVEHEGAAPSAVRSAGVRTLRAGDVDRLMGPGRSVLLRRDVAGEVALYGAGAPLVRSDALVRLNLRQGAPSGLLALGSRQADRFGAGQGTELLQFLGRSVEHCLRAGLGLVP